LPLFRETGGDIMKENAEVDLSIGFIEEAANMVDE
jgi:hypothetical protein